jgi:CheY-like chemotaxis protein
MSKKILIVEDEIITAMAIGSELGTAGIQTVLALSCAEAIQCAETEKPDLALIDIHLGNEMDGIETARRIKDRFGIPTIFMTGYSDTSVQEQADEVGCLGYLVKPVSVKSILAIIVVPCENEGI